MTTTVHSIALAAVLLAGLLSAGGCGADTSYMNDERLDRGLVVILPGIEGRSPLNADIRRGLDAAGIDTAMPIYAWGAPVPGIGMVINQTNFLGNRLAGANIAQFVTEYQDQHPGKPVYLVGHSGGGGVAVFAAEAMPPGRQIDGLVLLSASISANYDLTDALAKVRNGIVNFYNSDDVALLSVGTTIMGNVDGARGASAGLEGFTSSFPRLYEGRVNGSGDPHASTTRAAFVASRVAPWIRAKTWPPPHEYPGL